MTKDICGLIEARDVKGSEIHGFDFPWLRFLMNNIFIFIISLIMHIIVSFLYIQFSHLFSFLFFFYLLSAAQKKPLTALGGCFICCGLQWVAVVAATDSSGRLF